MAPPVANVAVSWKQFPFKKGVLEMNPAEKCPSCRGDMELGYLISGRPINWCDHPPKVIYLCGEHISKGYTFCSGVAGHRCKKCRIILYQEIEQEPKKDTNDWPAG